VGRINVKWDLFDVIKVTDISRLMLSDISKVIYEKQ
jgi:hypothetical protein